MEDKSKRYDRQIRIWGSETLKNLVLGGIASFTAVDAATVEPADLGTKYGLPGSVCILFCGVALTILLKFFSASFMLDADNLGQTKAKCVCGHLKELNESVNGSFVDEKPETLIESNPSFFTSFTLIIATQELCVVETKPDNKVEDLRLGAPWPELEKYVMEFDMNSLDDKTYKHVPWAIILMQAARKWKDEHGGNLPSSYKERNELKAQIRSIRRSLDEENFDEALSNAHWIWALPTIGSEVRTVLESPKTEVHSSSSDFWKDWMQPYDLDILVSEYPAVFEVTSTWELQVLAAALKNFYAATGDMPLEGSVPDMTSTTE
eukprot:gene14980-17708_t